MVRVSWPASNLRVAYFGQYRVKSAKATVPPPWKVEQPGPDRYEVRDANGFRLASINFRDDLRRSFGHGHLTSDEARRIAKAIARLPEF